MTLGANVFSIPNPFVDSTPRNKIKIIIYNHLGPDLTNSAQVFASHLCNTFLPHRDISRPCFFSQFLPSSSPYLPGGYHLYHRPHSLADIIYIVDHLPCQKAPDFHLVISQDLRHCLQRALVFLSYLYNSIL